VARWLLLAAVVFAAAACNPVTWFLPDTTCADWQHLTDAERATYAEAILRADRIFENVQAAQHVPVDTPEEQLAVLAAESITKNCELQGWNPAIRVRTIVHEIYAPLARLGRATAAIS